MAQSHPQSSIEARGFRMLVALLAAPVVAQGLWLPFQHFVGRAGSSGNITGSALAIATLIVLAGTALPGAPSWLPLLLGCLTAGGAAALLGLGTAGLLTLLVVAAAGAWLDPWLSSRLPSTLDGLGRRHKKLTLLYALMAMMSVSATTHLSIFIGDPSRVDQQLVPGDKFVETHSCLTAYVRAAELSSQGVENLYDDHWWYGSLGLPPAPEGQVNPYQPFVLDNFSYPPPFLLVMKPLEQLSGDFHAQRALWFGFNGLLAAIGLWVVARWIDGPGSHRALLLAPLYFASPSIMVVLQIGNFHVAAMAMAVLAMVAFDRGRALAGGTLLGLGILSKVSPGILGIVLLAQRRYRVAAITAGCGLILLLLSTLNSGLAPLQHFVTFVLPRLSSGAAFPFIDTPMGIATNMSPFGIAFKLPLLGIDVGDPWALGKHIARAYTLFLVGLAIVAGRRKGDRRDQALSWMGLLSLAALQSPFAPAYSTLALGWATTLLAVEVKRLRGAVGLVLSWLIMLVVPPGMSPAQHAIQSLLQTGMVVGVCAWMIVRTPRTLETPLTLQTSDTRQVET